MIVITTPTGQIGRQVLGNLLDGGEQLRVIARDPSQLPAEVREDFDIVVGLAWRRGGFTRRRGVILQPSPTNWRRDQRSPAHPRSVVEQTEVTKRARS